MGRHKDDLRAEAEERNAAYQAAHPTPAVKLLTEVFTAPEKDTIIQDAGEEAIKRTRRRRNVTRQHKAHTD
jgi:hypothetical protein